MTGGPGEGVAAAVACASCGELVQGRLRGRDFLVTCPVGLFSRAEVRLGGGGEGFPPDRPKAARAARLALAMGLSAPGRPAPTPGPGFELRIESDIPVGKGMASSTADVAAAAAAALAAAGADPDPRLLARVALMVEPSDGLMFPGVAIFDHRRGTIGRSLGPPPPLAVHVFDLGGSVDTIEFNSRPGLDTLNDDKAPEVSRALALVAAGIARGDASMVAEGATVSALANQSVLHKEGLEEIRARAGEAGALRINVAHSGTVVGVLAGLPWGERPEAEDAVREAVPYPYIGRFRLRGGGVEVLTGAGRTGAGSAAAGRG